MRGILTGAGANIRREPSTSAPIVGKIPVWGLKTVQIDQTALNNRLYWIKVSEGWVRNDVADFYPILERNWDVPFYDQEGPDAQRYSGDCGAASFKSLVNWWNDLNGFPLIHDSIDSLARDLLGLSATKRVASGDDVIFGLHALGLGKARMGVKKEGGVDVPDVGPACQYIYHAPFIQLADYQNLPDRYFRQSRIGHWFPVFGTTYTSVLFHDPVKRGFQTVTWEKWGKIVSQSIFNRPNQGIVL